MRSTRFATFTIFISVLVISQFSSCGGSGGQKTSPPVATAIVVLGGNNQSATVASRLPIELAVQATSSSGEAVGGVALSWNVTAGGGSLSNVSTITDSAGSGHALLILGTTAGVNTVTVSSGTLTPAVFSETGRPGAATGGMTLSNPKNPMAVGDVVQIAVAGKDQYGNSVAPSWTASPSDIVTIDDMGRLTALSPGAGFVTAQSGNLSVVLPIVVNGSITFTLGAEEVVFKYNDDHCEALDVPDVPAKAVRLADGSITLIAGDAPDNFAMFGADFSSLHRSCSAPTLMSDLSPDASTFNNAEWVHAAYRLNGTIHALIHNEFHDPIAPDCPQTGYLSCWYNSITYAYSVDGGHTFVHAQPPQHVVAPPAAVWNADPPRPNPYGYFNPSNIVLGQDSYYYSVFMAIDTAGNQGMCVMRTQSLEDPASWRSWDGKGFNLQMADPYTGSGAQWCTQVFSGGLPGSLTFNTYLNAFILISDIWTPSGCGTAYITSKDLIHWSPLTWLRAGYQAFASPDNAPACMPPSGQPSFQYSSFIDHVDTTANFERPGQTPYLYYTRFNGSGNPLDRDLVRVPVVITVH